MERKNRPAAGNYLNSADALTAYTEVYKSPYFVDKSEILDEIIPRIGTTEKYICITRLRRFGKSVLANMLSAFFSWGSDSEDIFRKIADSPFYAEHINKHPVISVSFNRLPRRCASYEQYISRIEQKLMEDIRQIYPHVKADPDDAVWDVLRVVYQEDSGTRFILCARRAHVLMGESP